MLRYPAPKTGLGIGHIVSQVRINIIRSIVSENLIMSAEVSLVVPNELRDLQKQ